MLPIRAVIFDFIGTLANMKNYSLKVSEMKLYKIIADAGFDVNSESFLEVYNQAHEKYRVVRYQKFVEVTNAVWISEALNNLGFKTSPDDPSIKTVVNVFFEDYLNSLEFRRCTKRI